MTDEHEAVMAIDGGNSKTDLVLLSAGGELLASERSGPFQPQLSDAASAVASFTPAVERILTRAAHPTLLQVSAYLANADLPVETADIRRPLSAKSWSPQVTVENDTFAVLRAGTDRGHGVAVVCGAGHQLRRRQPERATPSLSGARKAHRRLGRRPRAGRRSDVVGSPR